MIFHTAVAVTETRWSKLGEANHQTAGDECEMQPGACPRPVWYLSELLPGTEHRGGAGGMFGQLPRTPWPTSAQTVRTATAAASQWVVKAVNCPTQADHSWAVCVASSAGVVGHAGVGLNEADTARMLVGGQHLRLLSDFRLSAPGFSSFLHGPAGAGVWTCLVVVVA